jgi:hypothetical protein
MTGAHGRSVLSVVLMTVCPMVSLLVAAQEKKEFRYAVGPRAMISATNNYGSITVKPSARRGAPRRKPGHL